MQIKKDRTFVFVQKFHGLKIRFPVNDRVELVEEVRGEGEKKMRKGISLKKE